MHTFLNMIHNFGNGLHFIGLEADKLYKFASKKVREVINMILQNSTGDDLIDYKVYGNSKQSTTTGKNKANPNEFVKGRLDNGVIGYASGTSSIEYSEPTLTVETNTLYRGFVSNLIELATSNFFISFSSSTNAVSKIAYYDESKNFISQSEYNSLDNVNGKKLTKPANAKYFRFSIEYQTVGTFTLSNIQVEENSSSATVYEPYTGGIASPNPDYPQEIQSVGDLVESGEYAGKYKIPVKISGKNKVHLTDVAKTTIANGTYKVENQIATLDGGIWAGASIAFVGSATSGDFPTIFTLKKGKTYNIKMFNIGGTATTLGHNIALRGKTGNLNIGTKTITNMIEGFSYTPTQDEECVGIFAYFTAATFDNFKFQIQIKEATITDNTFEPYHEPITKYIYLDKPIRKIGDVANYIDFKNQKDVRSLKRVVLNGSEQGWTTIEPYGHRGFVVPVTNLKLISSSTNIANLMSNYYNVYSIDQLFNYNSSNFGLCARTNLSELIFRNDDCADLNEFKNWLASHNIEVIYELTTQTEETVEPPEIPTFEGTTIIEVETEVQPSNMWVQYYATE